jgi:hypothetical protein
LKALDVNGSAIGQQMFSNGAHRIARGHWKKQAKNLG